jgi:hypothetical protein
MWTELEVCPDTQPQAALAPEATTTAARSQQSSVPGSCQLFDLTHHRPLVEVFEPPLQADVETRPATTLECLAGA